MQINWQDAAAIWPNAPMVVSETIDGEAIIMHHGNGYYFDARGTGGLIWQAVEAGWSMSAIAARLATATGIDGAQAMASVGIFLTELAAQDLVRAGNGPALALDAAPAMDFAPPTFGVHADLADMLLLDPVHDVDEGGWPQPRAVEVAD